MRLTMRCRRTATLAFSYRCRGSGSDRRSHGMCSRRQAQHMPRLRLAPFRAPARSRIAVAELEVVRRCFCYGSFLLAPLTRPANFTFMKALLISAILATSFCYIAPAYEVAGSKPIDKLDGEIAKVKTAKKLICIVYTGSDENCPHCAAAAANGVKAVRGSAEVVVIKQVQAKDTAFTAKFTPAVQGDAREATDKRLGLIQRLRRRHDNPDRVHWSAVGNGQGGNEGIYCESQSRKGAVEVIGE